MDQQLSQRVSGSAGVEGGFGIYVHWPFCQAKCPYCDFNSHVVRTVDHARWARAFTSEIQRYAAMVPGRRLGSVYFGGGTPSLMPPELVASILDDVRAAWALEPDVEITLEANPSSVEVRRFQGYVAAGVNRFSIGVQALNDRDLRRLGRLHSVAEAHKAVEVARNVCERVSFDLIYARQDQTADDWRAELKDALRLAPDHLSLYQLTIEDGTAFGARHQAGRLPGLPDAELSADLFDITQEICETHGLPAYETSNHARPGSEGRHNLVYWRYGEYLGIGPGAHGRLTVGLDRVSTRAESSPGRWLDLVESGQTEHEMRETIAAADQGDEYLMMGMRLREGVPLARYAALSGKSLPEATLHQLLGDGLVWVTGDRVGTTPRGGMVLNAVLRELL